MGSRIENEHPRVPANKTETRNQLFLGSFVHSKALDELDYLHNAAVCVDESGTIVAVERECDEAKARETVLPRLGWDAAGVEVVRAREGQFFFPGFIGECIRHKTWLFGNPKAD
jgi:hypothetical protein